MARLVLYFLTPPKNTKPSLVAHNNTQTPIAHMNLVFRIAAAIVTGVLFATVVRAEILCALSRATIEQRSMQAPIDRNAPWHAQYDTVSSRCCLPSSRTTALLHNSCCASQVDRDCCSCCFHASFWSTTAIALIDRSLRARWEKIELHAVRAPCTKRENLVRFG